MALENLGRVIGNIASTTAKKAGEQVQITRLGIDRAGLEKQIEGVYAAIGRYCYSRTKAGEVLPEEILEYCRDIDELFDKIRLIDDEVAMRKAERDAAEYTVASDFTSDRTSPITVDASFEETPQAADPDPAAPVETVESATEAYDAADRE